nr:hypothetical protein Iba_chr04aCG15570 [Ipomoea batatas]
MNGPKVFFVRVGPLAIELLPYGSGLTTTWTSSSMRPSLEFTCTTDCQKSGPTGQRPSTLSITKFEPKFTFMTFIIFNDILFVLHNEITMIVIAVFEQIKLTIFLQLGCFPNIPLLQRGREAVSRRGEVCRGEVCGLWRRRTGC